MATLKEVVASYCDRYNEKSTREIAVRLSEDYPGIFRNMEAARWHVRKYRPFDSPGDMIASTAEVEPAIDLEDKKLGVVDWKHGLQVADKIREAKSEASFNQSPRGTKINLGDDESYHFINLGDLHFFSSGTVHAEIIKLTEWVMSFKNLHIVLLGDIIESAINLRGVAEVQSNLMPTGYQLSVYEDWLKHIKDRVLFATWDNHASERMEKAAGCDFMGWITSRIVRFYDGIGHADLKLGNNSYKVFATHKVQGRSIYNATHGQQRYGKFVGQDREILLAGDSHVPGISHYWDGATQKLAVNVGTLNIKSAYGRRYFAPEGNPVFPVVSLYRDTRGFNAFATGEHWALAHGIKC